MSNYTTYSERHVVHCSTYYGLLYKAVLTNRQTCFVYLTVYHMTEFGFMPIPCFDVIFSSAFQKPQYILSSTITVGIVFF